MTKNSTPPKPSKPSKIIKKIQRIQQKDKFKTPNLNINIPPVNVNDGIGIAEKLFMKEKMVVLVYSNGCGHCTAMKDDWNTFCDKKEANTVGIDVSSLTSLDPNKKFVQTVKSNYSGFVPLVLKIRPDGKTVVYNGKRNTEGLQHFAAQK